MEYVTSPDGTRIAFERSGDGPPLVLIHGTGGASVRWTHLLPTLNQQFTVYAVNRRGRGGSDDTEPYAIQREFEDIAAVVDSISEPVNLLGHSYGAICSVEAAKRSQNILKLILYEPPFRFGNPSLFGENFASDLEALLATGDREAVVTTFLRDVVHMPDYELNLLRSLPSWAGRVGAAHTLPREMLAHDTYQPEPADFRDVAVPVLLLVGGDSPEYFKQAAAKLEAVLPDCRKAVMPDQQHVAMDTAPDLFLSEVIAFLS